MGESTRRPRSNARTIRILLLGLVALYVSAMSVRIYARKFYLFLPDYVRWAATPRPPVGSGPTHIFLLLTDHFEPSLDVRRVEHWAAAYRQMAAQHRDSVGRPPQHTWFYPAEQSSPEIMAALRLLTTDGLGEVELHYHHGWDTEATFREELGALIAEFQQFGFLKTVAGETRFAFTHGNSSLDNSIDITLCGVNTELRALRQLGSFADFTFPTVREDSQPPFVNAIYAVKDDDHPKSYVHRLPLTSIRDGSADLVIFQGPLLFAPSFSVRRLFIDVEDGNVHASNPASARRVDRWLRANVHVPGRPEWVFIKLFAHGLESSGDIEATSGESFSTALSYMEDRYNDGKSYVLHYITAREAYNLARAAAEGATGNPQVFMDEYVAPYIANRRSTPQKQTVSAR